MKIEPGTVVFVRECYLYLERPSEENINLTPKGAWAFVTGVRKIDGNIDVDWIDRPKHHPDEDTIVSYLSSRWDKFDVPSPDEWPQRVCVWVAKKRLSQ